MTMPELTLESLADQLASMNKQLVDRVAALEKQLAEHNAKAPSKAWLESVGMFDDDPDFDREVLAEARAIREAAREEALHEEHE
jgi:hypothetical protein